MERGEARVEGLTITGADSRTAPNSATSSVVSTPRLQERRTSSRMSAHRPSNDTLRSNLVGPRVPRPRTGNQRVHMAAATESTTAQSNESSSFPLPNAASLQEQSTDVVAADGETETRELSPLGRLPPTQDESRPYDIAQAVAFAAAVAADEGNSRINKPQPVSESIVSASHALGLLRSDESSFSVDSISSWESHRIDTCFSSAYQSTVPQPMGIGDVAPAAAATISVAPTIKPPAGPQSLDFLERCNAVKEQYLRHPVERRRPAASTIASACVPHMMTHSRAGHPTVVANGTRILDPEREIDPSHKLHVPEVGASQVGKVNTRLTASIQMYPQAQALGEGRQGKGSLSSIDVGSLSVSREQQHSGRTPQELPTSSVSMHCLPQSFQTEEKGVTSCVHHHSGDLDSVCSAVLEPNAVNGPARSSCGFPTLNSLPAAAAAFLVPIRGADGALVAAGADGSIPYRLTFRGHTQTVLLTGDMDDDLDVLEELEDELGVQVQVQGLAPDESDEGASSGSLPDSESGGRSLGGLSCSPSILSRKARRNAAGLRTGEVHSYGNGSPLLARTSLSHNSSQPVQLRLPVGPMAVQSASTIPVSNVSPPEVASVTAADSQTAFPEQDGVSPPSPAALIPRPVPRLSLQDVDVVALRANIEADAAAIQDDSLMLEPAVHGAVRAAPGGVATAPPVFLSPPTSGNNQGRLGPLSAFEGSAIHAARGANFKSQRVYAQRSAQHSHVDIAGATVLPVLETATASAPTVQPEASQTPTTCANFDYDTEAASRLLYHDADIHLAMLTLVITLLLSADGQLDPVHSPSDHVTLGAAQRSHDANLCTVMYHHLNHSRNRGVLPGLLQAAHAIGTPAVRLLKLLVHDLYSDDLVTGRPETFARGTFALVQKRRASIVPAHRDSVPHYVAEKVCPSPTNLRSGMMLSKIVSESGILKLCCFLIGSFMPGDVVLCVIGGVPYLYLWCLQFETCWPMYR